MKPRRHAVATYLQTFILVAVALAGAMLAYNAVSTLARAPSGPAVRIWDASIRQEAGVAVERLAVSDVGTTRLTNFMVLNPGLERTVFYCIVISSSNGTEVTKTCPAMEVNPTAVNVTSSLAPGRTVVVTVLLVGGEVVTAGRSYTLVVTASGGALATQQVVATAG